MSYSFDEYAKMLIDPVRGSAYTGGGSRDRAAWRSGRRHRCRPGVLGVYAATLGARRVFLIDPDASVYAGAELARENGVGDRVEVIRALSTEVELPESADVIVSDLRGVMPFHGHHLIAATDMRRRLLAPGGVCIPRRDIVSAALVQDDALHARTVGAWSGLPIALTHDSFTRLLANRWYRTRATEEQLLCGASHFVTLDYDLPNPALAARWETVADARWHGTRIAALVRHRAHGDDWVLERAVRARGAVRAGVLSIRASDRASPRPAAHRRAARRAERRRLRMELDGDR